MARPRFLAGLFESKAQATAETVVNRAVSGTVAAQSGQYALMGPIGSWDIEYAVKNGVEKVIWVFRCADVIAQNQASLNLVIRSKDPVNGNIVSDDRINRLLNRRPNEYETAQQFRYRLSMQLLLSRKGAFIEKVYNAYGEVTQLHLLPPHRTTPVPGQNNQDGKMRFVDSYKIYGANWVEYTIPPENVIWIKAKPHPLDPYAQMTPMVAAGIAADQDYYSRLFNRNFVANDGRPGMIVAVKGNLPQQDAEALKNRFSGGPTQAGKVTVIEADGLDVKDMTTNPRDVQWVEGINGSKQDIMLAFGVPESVMGNASGRTFDNADAERENFWMDTEVPHCNTIAAGLDELTGSTIDDLYIGYDYSTVDVLQRRIKEKHAKALEEVKAGTRTIDSYLKLTGEKPFDLPLTRSLILPNYAVIVTQPEDLEAVKETPILNPAAQGGGAAPGGMAPPVGGNGGGGDAQALRAFTNELAARAAQIGKSLPANNIETKAIESGVIDVEEVKEHPYEVLRAYVEGSIDGVLVAWSERQDAVIQERLMHTKVRKGTRHWEGEGIGTKALDATYVVEAERWATEAVNALVKMLRPLTYKEAVKAAKHLDEYGVIDTMKRDGKLADVKDPLTALVGSEASVYTMLDNLINSILGIVHKSAVRQTTKVADKISDMDHAGESIADIKREISSMIGKRSNWRRNLSTYVTTAAIEGTRAEVMNKAGDLMVKTWYTKDDEKVRLMHRLLDNQTKDALEPFVTPEGMINFPGDPTAPIGLTANCRCWLDYEPATLVKPYVPPGVAA